MHAADAAGQSDGERGHRRKGPGAAAALQGATVAERLAALYPDSRCSLDFRSPWELLVATILSAQCTDRRVNMVTPALFLRWPTAQDLARAQREELEAVIRTTGFFRAKARNLLGCAAALVERHAGKVPDSLDDLVRLPGVGRKTANVVLGVAFGRAEGVVVDTHVGRISRRLGLTRRSDAVGAERDLVRVVPRQHWIVFSHRLIDHGRAVCLARKPRCGACALADICPRKGVRSAAGAAPAAGGGRGSGAGHGKRVGRRVQSVPSGGRTGRKSHGSPP